MKELYEIIIIGAGPAGLTAGLYGSRSNLRTLIIEKGLPGGQLLNTEIIEDYTGFEHVTGIELAQKMEAHARKFGVEIKTGEEVKSIRRSGDLFEVTTDESAYRAITIVATAGGTAQKLGVVGEEEFAGRGVSYCAVCDGAFFNGQVITVVGGGDAAVEEANYLTRFGSKVYLVHRRNEFRAQKILQDQLFQNPKIEVIWDTVVEEIKGDREVDRVLFKNLKTGDTREHPTQGVFIFIGFKPNTYFLDDHPAHDESGHLITNDRMETNVPGLFAAGDLRAQLVRQITNAVGDATVAALAAEKYITHLKHKGLKE
ncbi:MAG: thioredoxin-disulfide reductase [Blastocatellia bacterium AA13]|nr:MAG: thioredoxin-disulfide reductase [Blastocatellia bacterium AA13]